MNTSTSIPPFVRRIAPPLSVFVIFVVLWQFIYETGVVPRNLLPSFAQVAAALYHGLIAPGTMWEDILTTLSSAATGYVIGFSIAFTVAGLMALFASAERFLVAYVLAFQAIPKVALAPLVFVWLGFGTGSTITLVALSCFYPNFVNGLAGFKSADSNLIDMYRAFGASPLRILLTVRLPAAAKQVFVGLEITVIFALIAAVVMEFISGSSGLGVLIQTASVTLDTPTAYAALVVLALFGMTANMLIKFLRRRILFWDRTEEAWLEGSGA